MIEIKRGDLLNDEPYTVTKNGVEEARGIKIVIGVRSGFKAQDKIMEVNQEDGSVLLIPEKVFKAKYKVVN